MDTIKKTSLDYGFLWGKCAPVARQRWHFSEIQEVIHEPLIRGRVGLEAGSGCGYDTYLMARQAPEVKILSLDISDGVFRTKQITSALTNVLVLKGSLLYLPVSDKSVDFVYSFGVLHHLPEPAKGLEEIRRILKEGAPVFLYLYEDHAQDGFKRMALKFTLRFRIITTKLPRKMLYVFCFIASPFIFISFSLPAMIFNMFSFTKALANKLPFNFAKNPFSLAADLYDRLSVSYEHRFSKAGVIDFLRAGGFNNISVTRIPSKAGWVVWGYKNHTQELFKDSK